MARAVATTKQTGGGGYSFEDKVATSYMAMMLAGQPPIGERPGIIRRVAFQNRSDGWLLDDLLLDLAGPDGHSRFALSVKSDQQVTSNGFPGDFVSDVWAHWFHEGTEEFDRDRDHLGFAVPPLPQNVKNGWHGLLADALDAAPHSLVNRLNTPRAANNVERRLFKSLACNLPGKSATDEEAVLLIRRLRVLEFDFEETPSEDERSAISLCQQVLASGARSEATDLWGELLRIARENAPAGGYVDLEKLLGRLRPRFRLREYVEYDSDIRQLVRYGKSLMGDLPEQIGGVARIDRREYAGPLVALSREHPGLVLLGPSGAGKTVLAKDVAGLLEECGPVAWLDSQALDEPTLVEVERRVGVRHTFQELLPRIAAPSALMVFDAVERFSENALRNAIQILASLPTRDSGGPWMVLLTCQSEEWEAVARMLLRGGIDPGRFRQELVRPPSDEEFESVWLALPRLRAIARRRELRTILRNLKILDIIATNAAVAGHLGSTHWVGESHVIRWFWEDITRGPASHARSRLLQRLGQSEAEGVSSRAAITDLSDAEAAVLSELEERRLCRVRDEQVSFAHDLFGDWARQRKLFAESARLREFLAPRITSPRWLKAIRLYGLDLLEQHGGDVTRWREAIDQFRPAPGAYDLATDLILESVVFAANPIPLLERVWPDLVRDDGCLLRCLLRRFLHVATIPNPLMLALCKDREIDTFTATTDRYPNWPYWLPMLRFLVTRAGEVRRFATREGALVANVWLRHSEPGWPCRAEAAEIALAIARDYVAKTDRWYRRDELTSTAVLQTAVAAVGERADEVSDLLLGLCHRTTRSEGAGSDADEIDDEGPVLGRPPWLAGEAVTPPPWPGGPRKRVEEGVRGILLDHGTLGPLIVARPAIAREIVLALTIRHPVPAGYGLDDLSLFDELGTESPHDWNPPMWHRGPFHLFLMKEPEEGLETIIRLVDHATDRWADRVRRGGGDPPSVELPLGVESRELVGGYDVYHWYLDRMVSARSVVCALMALEKWLYLKLEQGEPVERWIERLLRRGRSVAFAGVLIAVGRKHPELFEGPLKPLLAVWQFHLWEFRYHHLELGTNASFATNLSLMTWSRYGEETFNAAREWYEMPHRRCSFQEVALNLLLSKPSIRQFIDTVRARWRDQLARIQAEGLAADEPYLKKLIEEFDLNNWRAREVEGGVLLEFNVPEEELQERATATERFRRQTLLFTFPTTCRQALDRDEPLPAGELEPFWDQLRQMPEIYEALDDRPAVTTLEDMVCGGIAVLVVLHPEWVESRPDVEQWCTEWLGKVLSDPPSRGPLEFEGTLFDRHWDSFLADIAPAIWARDRDDRDSRLMVAMMAMSFRYETSAILMRRATRLRHALGDDLGRLQSLIVLWAAIRNIWNHSRSYERPWAGIERWRDSLADAFVGRKLPARIESWERVAEASKRRVAAFRLRRYRACARDDGQGTLSLSDFRARERRRPGLDVQLLMAVFRSLPTPKEALSDEERDNTVRLHRELLGICLRHARASVSDDHDDYYHSSEGVPDEFDRWILERVAELIPQFDEVEDAEPFWKPILDLDPEAHYWLESFLRSWFLHGKKAAPSSEAFAAHWKAMVEQSLSPGQSDSNRSPRRRGSMLSELMGLDWLCIDVVGGEEFRAVIGTMTPLYREWASGSLRDADTMKRFARFLRQPAASQMLVEGIGWVLESMRRYAGPRWDDTSETAEALLSLVEHWWRSRPGGLTGPGDGSEAAMGLLKILADWQLPRALELQDQIARRA